MMRATADSIRLVGNAKPQIIGGPKLTLKFVSLAVILCAVVVANC